MKKIVMDPTTEDFYLVSEDNMKPVDQINWRDFYSYIRIGIPKDGTERSQYLQSQDGKRYAYSKEPIPGIIDPTDNGIPDGIYEWRANLLDSTLLGVVYILPYYEDQVFVDEYVWSVL